MNTKNTKRILCYGDSNTWGWIPSGMGKLRYDINKRWPGILQNKLGNDYEVIEEGLGGRTTMFDDPRPEFSGRNAFTTLPIIIETHLPLDLVILMLGTTDTKEMLNLSVDEITNGIRKLIKTIKKFKTLDNTISPKILIIVPPIVDETANFASQLFKGGTEKAKSLVNSYKKVAEEENVLYLDPTNEIFVNKEEGVHMDNNNHSKLAELIYNEIKDNL